MNVASARASVPSISGMPDRGRSSAEVGHGAALLAGQRALDDFFRAATVRA
jgi:hypothetical protein